jgi:hypothetical protein
MKLERTRALVNVWARRLRGGGAGVQKSKTNTFLDLF